MSQPAITITDLKYRYRGGERRALDDINFSMNRGEFVVIMGASEAGKSTLSTSINGLIPHFHKGRIAGDVIVILEAMKMETEVRAQHAGTVAEVMVKVGDKVAVGDPLIGVA